MDPPNKFDIVKDIKRLVVYYDGVDGLYKNNISKVEISILFLIIQRSVHSLYETMTRTLL